MQVPLEIAFHNMEPSEFIEAKVRERVDKLERYCDRITRCSVGIEAPHRAYRQGNLYHVRIEIGVPGKELVVSRDPETSTPTRTSMWQSATPSTPPSGSSPNMSARSRRRRSKHRQQRFHATL
jgi:hypothetical protein